MIENEYFYNNTEFIIDEKFYEEFFSKYKIKKYKVCEVPINSIRMRQNDGGYIKAINSPLCKSLQYDKIENVSEEEFLYTKKLIENISKEGYDERRIIIVNEFNMLIDGQHRLYYYIMKENVKTIRVLKLYLKKDKIIKKVIQLFKSIIIKSLKYIFK